MNEPRLRHESQASVPADIRPRNQGLDQGPNVRSWKEPWQDIIQESKPRYKAQEPRYRSEAYRPEHETQEPGFSHRLMGQVPDTRSKNLGLYMRPRKGTTFEAQGTRAQIWFDWHLGFKLSLRLTKKHLPPQLSSLCLVLEKILPRPPAYWLGEILETVSRPNFRPAKR